MMVEEIFNPESCEAAFAVWHKGKEVEYLSKIEEENAVYLPLVDDVLTKGSILLPTGIKEYESETVLFDRMNDFIHKWYDGPEDQPIMSSYSMLTWLYDKCMAMPLLDFRAPRDSGKTRGAMCCLALSYRGIRSSGCASDSAIFRTNENWKGTVFINEGDMGNSEETSFRTNYLLERYESGGSVWRVDTEDHNRVKTFQCYGPTILTTREEFVDDALESRCFTITPENTEREDIIPVLTQDFFREAEQIRNSLLAFRFKWFPTFDPDYSIKFKGVNTRLNQILQPIASIAKLISPEFSLKIRSIAKGLNRTQVEGSQNSTDNMIVRAYFQLEEMNNQVRDIPLQNREYDQQVSPVDATHLSEIITKMGGNVSPVAVGRRMTVLKFQLDKVSGGSKKNYTVRGDRRKKLALKYLAEDEYPEDVRLEIESNPHQKLIIEKGRTDGSSSKDG